jgi:serine/threonine protein phosphatase PrpC
VLRAYGLTDKGRVRPTNEDCFAIREELGLCVIADGMGGHNAGEVAARLAVDAVVEFIGDRGAIVEDGRRVFQRAPGDRRTAGGPNAASERDDDTAWPFGYDGSLSVDGNLLRTAIHLANVQVFETANSSDRFAGMGTTIVAARVSDGALSVAHVGDSRLYLAARRRLHQVTVDDSWLASMLAQAPDANPFLLQQHRMSSALTNVVGVGSRTNVHVSEQPLAGGELILLSTDGVPGVLDYPRLEELVLDEEDPRAIVKNVVAAALTRGSSDNCTAVAARYLP